MLSTILMLVLSCATPPTTEELALRIEQLEKRQFDTEKKLDNQDKKLDAILAAVTKQNQPVVQVPVKPSAVVANNAPQGHTHTCANGHTWDHTQDGGTHRCPVCGLPQTTVDSTMKSTTLPHTGLAYQQSSVYTLQSSGTYSLGASGCANGSCSNAGYAQTTYRSGPIRRLLGR